MRCHPPSSFRSRSRLVIAATAAVLALATGVASATPPLAPAFGPQIDPYARYEGQSTCSPTDKPGTQALRDLVLAAYPATASISISRACSGSDTSEHKEGRAWDWRVDRYKPADDASARELLGWLLATDRYGNPAANARRLGIMYMIYDRKIWMAARPADGWRDYTGSSPHTDHVHFSLSWDGANKLTSYWRTAAPATTPDCATAAPSAGTPRSSWPATGFVGLDPTRILDTRTGLGSGGEACLVRQGRDLTVQVAGRAAVPTDGTASAVVLNLTGTASTTATYLSAFPGSSPWPGTSAVNPRAGTDAAALVVVPLSGDGRITVRNGAGTTHVVADVVGYFRAEGGAGYHPSGPSRVLDTRKGARMSAGSTRTLTLAGTPGLPRVGLQGVAVNVTAIGTGSPGWVAVAPTIRSTPTSSSVNLLGGQAVANRVLTGVSPDGTVDLYASAAADVVVDVVGWFGGTATDPGAQYHPLIPRRIVDTRNGTGTDAPDVSTRPVSVALGDGPGASTLPSGTEAVMVTLTSASTTAEGWLAAWPGGTAWPGTSDLNQRPEGAVANLVPLAVGSDGAVRLVGNPGRTEVVMDLLGYFAR